MTWSVLQSASKASVGAASTQTATFTTANVSSGTKLIAAITWWNNQVANTVTSVQDAALNSMTQVGFLNNTTAGQEQGIALYAMDTPAGDVGTKPAIKVTFGGAAPWAAMLVMEVSGLATGNTLAAMIDGGALAASSSGSAATTFNSGAYSSTASGEFLVGVFGDIGGPELVAKPSAWLTLDGASVNNSGNPDCCVAYTNSSNAAEGGASARWTKTSGTGASWATLLTAFKLPAAAAVAGGPGPAQPGKTWLRRFHHPQAPPAPAAPGAVNAAAGVAAVSVAATAASMADTATAAAAAVLAADPGASAADTATAAAATVLAADPGATVSTAPVVNAPAGAAAVTVAAMAASTADTATAAAATVLAAAPAAATAHTAAATAATVLTAASAATAAHTATAGAPAVVGASPAPSAADTATAGAAVVLAADAGATVSAAGSVNVNAGVAAVLAVATQPATAAKATAGVPAVLAAGMPWAGRQVPAAVATVTTAAAAPVPQLTGNPAPAAVMATAAAASGQFVLAFTIGVLDSQNAALSVLGTGVTPAGLTAATSSAGLTTVTETGPP